MKKSLQFFSMLLASASVTAAPLVSPLSSDKAELARPNAANAAATQTSRPTIKDNSIVSGNRELLFDKNGHAKLGSGGIVYAEIFAFFNGDNPYTQKREWVPVGNPYGYNHPGTEFHKTADGFDYTGVLALKTGADTEVTWKQYVQKSTLLEDGRIRFEGRNFPCPDPKIDLKWNGFWIEVPYQYIEGGYVELCGEKRKITAGGKNFGVWKTREFKVVVFAGDPEREFTVTAKKGTDCLAVGVIFLENRIRISFTPLNNGKVACNLDIRL